MATSKHFFALPLQLVIFIVLIVNPANAQLKVGFYSKTCPQAESIVKKVIHKVMSVAPSLSGPLLRMHFHDCFVRGCDGSLLLNSSTNQAEKDAPPNLSLRGYQVIDRVKAALEKKCPGVVSCADILAIVARDVVVATKGPFWEVETGRRDGRVSNSTEALQNLLAPTSDISTLISGFRARGLSVKDLVVLSGGHTIGTSHCSSFPERIYKNSTPATDPTLDPNYARALRKKCKADDTTTLVEMDPGSVRTFDAKYFTGVNKRRGLFHSDAALLDNSFTKAYVKANANSPRGSTFFKDFGVSMVNMARIGVLTGCRGEIRKVCYKTN